MLKLSKSQLNETTKWDEIGVALPKFSHDDVLNNTMTHPEWIHFGAGNIFRGFIGNIQQELLNQGKSTTGIIAVDSFDYEVIHNVYQPYDNLSLLVLMHPDGEFEKKVIGSITKSIAADFQNANAVNELKSMFTNPSLQMVSFTITEKGYNLTDASGEYLSVVQKDIDNGLSSPLHTMSMIAALLHERYKRGQYPLTLVSMDNCSHNGDILKDSVIKIALEWNKKGYVEDGFIEYIKSEEKITYPLTMIDKITPRPSATVKEHLELLGIEGMETIVTSKNSYMAPFVNAEVSEYLVIEDKFTNGRPEFEACGVIMTDRETVNKVETMKVTTCLNPLHTALAVSGCLLGYTSIAEEVKDVQLNKLIKAIGYDEGLKVVVDPEIINPKAFIDEVINVRFANPNIPDTPQRIATDTSQKVGIRFGETIKSYIRHSDLDVTQLVAIPLAIALWCRYLKGIDDNGDEFVLSSDPMSETLSEAIETVWSTDTPWLNKASSIDLSNILSNTSIFGVDLIEVGLGEIIEEMFLKLAAGKGAIRQTLMEYYA